MLPLRVVTGDVTEPIGEGPFVLPHVVTDGGVWEAGITSALSRRWPETENAYRDWCVRRRGKFGLGRILAVEVADGEDDLIVVHMMAQQGLKGTTRRPAVRYDHLRDCLILVADIAVQRGASVHMPRIGCGYAGGTWDRVGPIVKACLCERDIETYVYDYTTEGRR